jgi:hypothetical protein
MTSAHTRMPMYADVSIRVCVYTGTNRSPRLKMTCAQTQRTAQRPTKDSSQTSSRTTLVLSLFAFFILPLLFFYFLATRDSSQTSSRTTLVLSLFAFFILPLLFFYFLATRDSSQTSSRTTLVLSLLVFFSLIFCIFWPTRDSSQTITRTTLVVLSLLALVQKSTKMLVKKSTNRRLLTDQLSYDSWYSVSCFSTKKVQLVQKKKSTNTDVYLLHMLSLLAFV